MAVVRARSAPPYGLFAAVAFAVLATAGAVVFYMLWTGATADHDKLAADAKSKSEAAVKANSERDEATQKLATAQGTIDLLQGKLNAAEEAQKKSESALAVANAGLDGALKNVSGGKATFDVELDKLQTQLTTLQGQVTEANKKLKDAQDAAQTDLGKQKQDADDQRRVLVLQIEDLKSQIARAGAEIFDLRQRIQNMRGTQDVAVGEPDGKVVSVNNTNGEVYINLGKKDRILPGMPFTAYDSRTGVRFGTDEAALGNGSIEVTAIQDNTAICRITRTTTNRAIQAGDLISNIVYHNDKTRKFHFTVYGDFDLDGDGIATAAERDRLITLIQAWGGQVDSDVTSQTDYLVLGDKPKGAMTADDAAATTTAPADPAAATAPSTGAAGSVADVRVQDQDRYEALEISAKRLAIPVLNQNRFLAMVGYYNTTVVRY